MKLSARITLLTALLLAPLAGTLPAQAQTTQTVVLAGGCFWGMEAVFGALKENHIDGLEAPAVETAAEDETPES